MYIGLCFFALISTQFVAEKQPATVWLTQTLGVDILLSLGERGVRVTFFPRLLGEICSITGFLLFNVYEAYYSKCQIKARKKGHYDLNHSFNLYYIKIKIMLYSITG